MPDSRITYTPHLNLSKLPANFHVWAQIMNDNLTTLDAAVSGFILIQNLRGSWTNSTAYAAGDSVVDTATALIWRCQVTNTSSTIPTTFAQERVAFPLYWVQYSTVGAGKGTWTGPGTSYVFNDFVSYQGRYAVCILPHTSTASFNADVASGYWNILIDVSAYLPLVGGTLTGPLIGTTATFSGSLFATIGSFNPIVNIDGTAGVINRILSYSSGGVPRWAIGVNNVAESGGNAGSDFFLNSANDAGAYLASPLLINRSTSAITLGGALTGTTATFTGSVTVGNPLTQVSNDPNWTMRTAASTVAWRVGSNITGTTDGYWYLQHSTNNFSSSSVPLLIDQTGAATFTGTITGKSTDGSNGLLIAGATKGVRIVPNPTFTAIEGVDNTGIGSYQPLTINGTVINVTAPLTGTTASFTGTVSAPGAQIQMVSTETGAVATGSTLVPFDDTIPQITEGDQYMTLAITPKSATSKLIIEVIFNCSCSGANPVAVVLFQDATANALAASFSTTAFALASSCITLRHTMTSGTTSGTTFRVRAGPNAASTVTFNGQSGGRIYGGVMASSIVITETV